MRVAYLDCFAGIAGDMFLGALLQAGVPAEVLHEATDALGLGASLRVETVDRSGIAALKVHVLEAGEPAEVSVQESQEHEAGQQQEQQSVTPHSHQPRTQHLHKVGHTQTLDHPLPRRDAAGADHHHKHHRSLSAIHQIIAAAPLHPTVKDTAMRTFDRLGHAEAKVHNVAVDTIHFHEVGAVDAIVDIVAASAGIHHLEIGKWYSSPINVGSGMVRCAHGYFPVPAPATADLLRGVPTYAAHLEKELTTPTGAALLCALDCTFGPQPPMHVTAIGYGAGTRNPEGFPNVLRLSVGEQQDEAQPSPLAPGIAEDHHGHRLDQQAGELVTVLETALDDLSPQVIAYAAEKALEHGALDVMLTPVIMKKGRPGTLLTVLCKPADSGALQELLLRETSTLGIRVRQDRRVCLDRTYAEVETPYGRIRIKVGSGAAGEPRNIAPEFADCRAAAELHRAPLKAVQQAALAAYQIRMQLR